MCPLTSGRGGRLAHLLLLLLFGLSIHAPLLVNGARESHLRIGKALNIFMRFGYLGISVHVIPYNDTTEEVRWLFREPTHNIYKVIRFIIIKPCTIIVIKLLSFRTSVSWAKIMNPRHPAFFTATFIWNSVIIDDSSIRLISVTSLLNAWIVLGRPIREAGSPIMSQGKWASTPHSFKATTHMC